MRYPPYIITIQIDHINQPAQTTKDDFYKKMPHISYKTPAWTLGFGLVEHLNYLLFLMFLIYLWNPHKIYRLGDLHHTIAKFLFRDTCTLCCICQ